MPQLAVKGIWRDGKVIPLEDVSYRDAMNVVIVFTGKYDGESYYDDEWLNAEEQASYDYKVGNVKSAPGIDEMFEAIENSGNGNQMVS